MGAGELLKEGFSRKVNTISKPKNVCPFETNLLSYFKYDKYFDLYNVHTKP